MPTVTLEEAQARLPELIAQLLPDGEITITADGQRLSDFDTPLEEFKEYME